MKAYRQVDMFLLKHVDKGAYKKYVNIKPCEHKSMWASKQVGMWANDYQSKYAFRHWAFDQQSIEHTSTYAFRHPSTHTSYRLITLGFKHDYQSMWVPEHPTTWAF